MSIIKPYFYPLLFIPLSNALAEDALRLEDVTVTAARTPLKNKKSASAAEIFTRADIERLQIKTLPELLKRSAGIDMVQNGGYGQATSLFMRGTESDHVLVIIDGVRTGSTTVGTAPFQFLSIDQIERVEIIKGPQSSLYGSEAIGGVIQIFTRKGTTPDAMPQVDVNIGGGSYDTFKASAAVSGSWKNSWYSLGSSYMTSNGYDTRQATSGSFGIDQPDKDGYDNVGLHARAGHHFDHNIDVEAFFNRSQGNNEYDSFSDKSADFLEQTVGGTISAPIMANWKSKINFGQSRDDSENIALASGEYSSYFKTTRWTVSWLNDVEINDEHKLIIGSDYYHDSVESSTTYNEDQRYNVGVFGQYNGEFLDNHFINASVRWDENQAFGDHVTGSVGWRSHWNYGISTLASFGTAFKAPTFNELYFPDFGNANLRPEESQSVEVGVTGNHDWGNWQVRAYHTDIDHLIIGVFNPADFSFSAQNVNKAQIDGIEISFNTEMMGWHIGLNGSLLDPVDRETNLQLARRSSQSLNFDLSTTFWNHLEVGTTVLARGHRYDDTQNTVRVAGFVTVDLRAAYHVTSNWSLNASLNNLLDKNYQTVNTYNMPDRNFFLSVDFHS